MIVEAIGAQGREPRQPNKADSGPLEATGPYQVLLGSLGSGSNGFYETLDGICHGIYCHC